MSTSLSGVIAVHVDAVNAFDIDAIVGTFTDVREVVDHYGDTIVRAKYDGDFDKTNLPDELIMSNYFSVREGKIVSLVVIRNQPSEY
jgi:hypothetical protein